MDIEMQIPAKTLIIEFTFISWSSSSPSSLDQKRLACRLFKILYISSTFTNKTIPYMKSISYKSGIISLPVLWNSEMFCKIQFSNVFFTFDMSFSKSKHDIFCFLFYFHTWNIQLIFCFQKQYPIGKDFVGQKWRNFWNILSLLTDKIFYLTKLIKGENF